jgi:hypothetical protein
MRQMTWMRRVVGTGPILRSSWESNWERHTGPVLWDNGGTHVVVDVVPDLEWAVVNTETRSTAGRVVLDFKAACDLAYDMDCAWRRSR